MRKCRTALFTRHAILTRNGSSGPYKTRECISLRGKFHLANCWIKQYILYSSIDAWLSEIHWNVVGHAESQIHILVYLSQPTPAFVIACPPLFINASESMMCLLDPLTCQTRLVSEPLGITQRKDLVLKCNEASSVACTRGP